MPNDPLFFPWYVAWLTNRVTSVSMREQEEMASSCTKGALDY